MLGFVPYKISSLAIQISSPVRPQNCPNNLQHFFHLTLFKPHAASTVWKGQSRSTRKYKNIKYFSYKYFLKKHGKVHALWLVFGASGRTLSVATLAGCSPCQPVVATQQVLAMYIQSYYNLNRKLKVTHVWESKLHYYRIGRQRSRYAGILYH